MEQNKNQDNPIQETSKPSALRRTIAGTALAVTLATPFAARALVKSGDAHTVPKQDPTEVTSNKPAHTELLLPSTTTTTAPNVAPAPQPTPEIMPSPAPASETSHVSHESHQNYRTHEAPHVVTQPESPSNPADQLPPGATVDPSGAVTSSANLTKNPDGTETLVVNGQVVPNQPGK